MKIINIDDSPFKHVNICNVLKNCGLGVVDIEWATNLEKGIEMICEQEESYDLIITDMWYPEKEGGENVESGAALIKKAIEEKWNIPIILVSTVPYVYSEILGTVRYGDELFWEDELMKLVKRQFKRST